MSDRPAPPRPRIELLRGQPTDVLPVVEPLLLDYLRWCARRIAADCGYTFEDPEAVVARHHEGFCCELPRLLAEDGRLVVARAGHDTLAGVAGLKTVGAGVAEVKRMYVRPELRGRGTGRGLMTRLLEEAVGIGHRVVRLETASFMVEAQRLYRSLGFEETRPFAGSEADLSGLGGAMRFYELRLAAG